jgi:hypothetical protein
MKKQKFLLILILLFLSSKSFSQKFSISEPKLEYDGTKLSIVYDLIAQKQSDVFSIWVEMTDQSGKPIRAYTFKGDVGDMISPGSVKKITWFPEDDGKLLDEDVSVVVSGERYEMIFNKSTVLLTSSVLPGSGLSKIKSNKAWWLAAVPVYGAVAGGFIYHSKYQKTYSDYKAETDVPTREDLLAKSKTQNSIASACFISAAVIWAADMVWVAASKNRYKPLQHTKLSVGSVPYNRDRINMLSIRVDF